MYIRTREATLCQLNYATLFKATEPLFPILPHIIPLETGNAREGLTDANWILILNTALHSIRSLLCTSTNCIPHKRMFNFPRKSSNGYSIPEWLISGMANLRNFICQSKTDPHYSRIRYEDGRESTVSTSDLAPAKLTLCEDSLPTDHTGESNSDNGLLTNERTTKSSRPESDTPSPHKILYQPLKQDREE
ncbi:hypothetical protein GJ496_008204 [Pomphorhynchus laevis]|nr:hypothetical protein GJ496_008204 [Pomphorhynchus laevis]